MEVVVLVQYRRIRRWSGFSGSPRVFTVSESASRAIARLFPNSWANDPIPAAEPVYKFFQLWSCNHKILGEQNETQLWECEKTPVDFDLIWGNGSRKQKILSRFNCRAKRWIARLLQWYTENMDQFNQPCYVTLFLSRERKNGFDFKVRLQATSNSRKPQKTHRLHRIKIGSLFLRF